MGWAKVSHAPNVRRRAVELSQFAARVLLGGSKDSKGSKESKPETNDNTPWNAVAPVGMGLHKTTTTEKHCLHQHRFTAFHNRRSLRVDAQVPRGALTYIILLIVLLTILRGPHIEASQLEVDQNTYMYILQTVKSTE